MMKLLKNKTFIAGISVALAAVVIVAAVVLVADRKSIPAKQNSVSTESSAEVHVKVSMPSETEPSDAGSDAHSDGSALTVDVWLKNSNTTKAPKTPSARAEENSRTGTKTPDKPDDTVSVGTGKNTSSDPKSPGSSTDGVIGVEPVPRGEEPSGASGVKPQSTDWVSINSNIPQELYNYNYTLIDDEEIITGAQMKWRGYTTWNEATDAAKNGLAQYFTIDYRKITSTDPNDRDKFLTDLVYWTGEAAHMDICEYMKYAINNKIISTASVVTDGSLMYNNGYQLIRARVYVTFQSGAGAYGLQNGVKYYRDVEVAVYPSNHENRYGFGACNDFNVLIFSYLNNLCAWKRHR